MKPVEIEFLMKDHLSGGLDKAGLAVDILASKAGKAAEAINAGDEVAVDFDTGIITDVTTGKSYQAQPFPPFIQNIIKCFFFN